MDYSMYCPAHQNGAGVNRVRDFYTFTDLHQDFRDSAQPAPDMNRLPFKLGIFLLENEYRLKIWKKIKYIKNSHLITFLQRLGVKPKRGWRKVVLQEVLLLNAGHPLFAENLFRCLEENNLPTDEAMAAQHEVELELARRIGHADRWYTEYQEMIAFDEFQ